MLILIIKVCSMYSSFRWIVELCSFYSAHFFSYAREHSLCHHMTFNTVEEFVNRWRKHVVLNNLVQVSCEILLKLGWHLTKSIKYGVLNEQQKIRRSNNLSFQCIEYNQYKISNLICRGILWNIGKCPWVATGACVCYLKDILSWCW